jgi:muconolactone D-isomerase
VDVAGEVATVSAAPSSLLGAPTASSRCQRSIRRITFRAPEALLELLAEGRSWATVEFLVEIDVRIPPDFDDATRADLAARETARGAELRASGTIVRIWRIPGRRANVGIWSAANATDLHAAIESLPMFPHLTVTVRPLATHPLEA